MLNIEDYDEQMEENCIKSINAEIDETIENFIGYLRSSYNVEKCLDEKTTEIYSAILLSMEHRDCHSAYLITGCETLANVLFELNEDIEMSIFLSIHGMYKPANVLLRRWLDTTINALSFDSELKKYKEKRPNKFDTILENGWNWLTKPHKPVTFRNRLYKNNFIDTKTDNIAKQLLKEKPYFIQLPYLFSWDKIPGNDNGKLIKFLNRHFAIEWVKTAKIEKIDGGRAIKVSNGKKYLSLSLNDEKTKVYLKTDDGITYEFIAKTENSKLNIYQSSFKKYIYDVFMDLSKSAHYTGNNFVWYNQCGYNEELFEKWYLKLNQINEICNILILLKFPEMLTLNKKHNEIFPTLEMNQMTRLIKLL